jgi:hypothetical protein
MLNSNQFKMNVVKGFVDASTPNRLLTAKIADTETATLVAGQCVKIADINSKVLPLLGSTKETDDHAGVLVFTTHRNEYKANQNVEFAPLGSGAIVVLEANGAIANGAKVYFAPDGAKVTGAGTIAIGHAFNKATADGDLIRVILDVRN